MKLLAKLKQYSKRAWGGVNMHRGPYKSILLVLLAVELENQTNRKVLVCDLTNMQEQPKKNLQDVGWKFVVDIYHRHYCCQLSS